MRVLMRERAQWSWGRRVCRALRDFAPTDVCWLEEAAFEREGAADLELIHVDEDWELRLATERTREQPRFAIFQHGVGFADVSRERFAAGWRAAALTASFQDLSADAARYGFAFHPMPWGADRTAFVPPRAPAIRDYVLIVGHFPDEESLGEVLFAAAHAGGGHEIEPRLRRIGLPWNRDCAGLAWSCALIAADCGWPSLLPGLRVRHVGDANDLLCAPCAGRGMRATVGAADQAPLLCRPLAALYNRTPCDFHTNLGRVSDDALVAELQGARWVPVLRKFEGFEITGVEALFCGTRPIVYDLPPYRWYKGHARYVASGLPSSDLFLELVAALREAPEPVGADELAVLHAKFSWQALVPAFFERVRSELRGTAAGPGRLHEIVS